MTVDVDCTPAEARAFLGLPDLTPLHDKYVAMVLDTFNGTGSLDQMGSLIKSMSPLGDASIRMFQQMMDLGLASGGLSAKKPSEG